MTLSGKSVDLVTNEDLREECTRKGKAQIYLSKHQVKPVIYQSVFQWLLVVAGVPSSYMAT